MARTDSQACSSGGRPPALEIMSLSNILAQGVISISTFIFGCRLSNSAMSARRFFSSTSFPQEVKRMVVTPASRLPQPEKTTSATSASPTAASARTSAIGLLRVFRDFGGIRPVRPCIAEIPKRP